MFTHPAFRIQTVVITGVEYLDIATLESTVSGALQDRALLFFTQTNRFLFSPDKLSALLQNQFALASVTVGLREGTLFIQLEERTSQLFWRTQNRLYVVDLEGVVVREVKDEQDSILLQPNLKELPIFIDANNVSVEVGSIVLTPNEVESAFRFLEQLTQGGVVYAYVEIDRLAGKWVKLVTEPGYSILFDLTGDIDAQYRNLIVVLQEITDTSALEYIDLRFGDKVYYK
ncbi:hypothetical protein HY630_00795 [Candidatus Uhrbacteria bacterium]|nr:hypothetical protein [Candidatus Uhrbacteria bacterium]